MSNFRTLDDLGPDVGGNAALVRVDFNVPMANGRITDDTRLRVAIPTIKDLQAKNAAIVLMAHFGRPKGKVVADMSLKPIVGPLSDLLGRQVKFTEDLDHPELAAENLKPGEVLLLENLRFKAGEEANDPKFVTTLAHCGDYFVNDAFSAAHRAHASTEGLAHKLPAYAGRSMQAELEALTKALEAPQRPVIALVGGAKVSTKLDLLENLITRVQALVIGGAMANTFLHAQGINVQKSLAEKDMAETARRILAKAEDAGCAIILPVDAIVAFHFQANAPSHAYGVDALPADGMVLDVGSQSIERIKGAIDDAATLVWNGPLGAFEMTPFDQGTVIVAHHAAERTKAKKLVSVAGGGDTVAALNHAHVADKFTYVSTAGGAFLEWLEGRKLPGVEALRVQS
jgi:phosphoglycerate kinase